MIALTSEVMFSPQTPQNMEQITNFSIIKQKIIKTDEVLRLYAEKMDHVKKLQDHLKQLKSKFDYKAGEVTRFKLENQHLSYSSKSTNEKYEALCVENSKLKTEFARLETDYHDTINNLQLKYQSVSQELVDLKNSPKSGEPPSPTKKTQNKKCPQLECQKVKSKFSSLETEFQSLKLEFELTKNELNECREKLQKASADRKPPTELFAVMKERKDFVEFKSRYAELELEVSRLKKHGIRSADNGELDTTIECLESKIISIEEEKQKLIATIDSLQTENSGYRLQLSLQASEPPPAEKSPLKHVNEMNELKKKFQKLEKDNSEAKKDNLLMKEVLSGYELEISTLKEQLRNTNSTPSENYVNQVLNEMTMPRSLSPMSSVHSVFDHSEPAPMLPPPTPQFIVTSPRLKKSVISSPSGRFTVSTLNEISSQIGRRRTVRLLKVKKKKPKVDVLAVLKAFQKSNIKFTITNEVASSSSSFVPEVNNFHRYFTPFVEVKRQEKSEKVVENLGKCLCGCKKMSNMLLKVKDGGGSENEDNFDFLGFFDVKSEVDSRPGSRVSFVHSSEVSKISVKSRKLKQKKLTIKETEPNLLDKNSPTEKSNHEGNSNDERMEKIYTRKDLSENHEEIGGVERVGNTENLKSQGLFGESSDSEPIEDTSIVRKRPRRKIAKKRISKVGNADNSKSRIISEDLSDSELPISSLIEQSKPIMKKSTPGHNKPNNFEEVDDTENLNPSMNLSHLESETVPVQTKSLTEEFSPAINSIQEVGITENLKPQDIFGDLSCSDSEDSVPIEENAKPIIKRPARSKKTVLSRFRNNLRKIHHQSKLTANVDYSPPEPMKKQVAHTRLEPSSPKIAKKENPKSKKIETSLSPISRNPISETVDAFIINNNSVDQAKTSFKRPVCSIRRSPRLSLTDSPKKLKMAVIPQVLSSERSQDDDSDFLVIDEGSSTPSRSCDDFDEGPQSPPPEDATLNRDEEPPKIIPLEKVSNMEPSKIGVLFENLINYSDEEKALDQIVDQFANQDPQFVAQIVLERVSADFVDKPDNRFSFAPMMTETQRVMLGFMWRMDRIYESGICDRFLVLAERELLTCTVLNGIAPITRVYLAICKLRKDVHRMRRFCCDFFYFGGNFAVPFLFIVLTSWCEVLPKFSEAADVPLARILVQAVYTKDCNKPGYNFLPLRDLLIKYYQYPTERWNSDELFQELFNRYLKNPASRSSSYNLLLFCKNNPEKWVHGKIEEHFRPLVDKISTENFKAAVIILVGNLSHNFSKESEFLTKIREWLRSLVTDQTHDVVKRSVYLTLQRLSKKS